MIIVDGIIKDGAALAQSAIDRQYEAYNELACFKYTTAFSTAASVLTVTCTQSDGENLCAIIEKQEVTHSSDTISLDITAYAGTDAIPQAVYIYFKDDGSGNLVLAASNTSPHDAAVKHSDVAYCMIGLVGVASTNVYGLTNPSAYIYERIEKLLDRATDSGMLYKSGIDITSSASSFAIATGEALMAVETVDTPALTLDGATDDQFQILNAGTYTSLNTFQLSEYYDGVAISDGDFVRCRIGIVVDTTALDNMRFHIIPQSGASTYTESKKAWEDKKQMASVIPRVAIIAGAWMPVADIVIGLSGAVWSLAAEPNTGLYHRDARTSATASVSGTTFHEFNVANKTVTGLLTASEIDGGIIQTTGAITLTLPIVSGLNVGAHITFMVTDANILTLTPNAADRIILDGTALADGVSIAGPATAGSLMELYVDSAAGWTMRDRLNVWA